jgi:hypothetical protein
MFLLAAFLYPAQAQPSQSWHGKTSEDLKLTISVVQGAVASISVSLEVSCANAVDEGTKLFTGPAVSIAGNALKFTGQSTTLCGVVQVRLEGTIDGTKASGNLTVIPPKLAAGPAKRKLTWKAEEDVAGK